ncbi:hypothetical protein MMC16_000383 [Acarospora aff. strigata]|nr:hypothetical protein [Acarospora aff. strigata]
MADWQEMARRTREKGVGRQDIGFTCMSHKKDAQGAQHLHLFIGKRELAGKSGEPKHGSSQGQDPSLWLCYVAETTMCGDDVIGNSLWREDWEIRMTLNYSGDVGVELYHTAKHQLLTTSRWRAISDETTR